jgi:UDP-glucose 4-epimerase
VLGGAGYIGAHVVRALTDVGVECIVIDDMSTGRAVRLPASVPLVEGDAADARLVHDACVAHRPSGVVHLAALRQARESVREPLRYWAVNLPAVAETLEALRGTHVRWLVFSSSCSVYGFGGRVREGAPVAPVSPYGDTKATAERVLATGCAELGINWVPLRYFNVVGCGGHPEPWDVSREGLVPRVTRHLREGRAVVINGRDFATPDGTAVRDYVDVRDLARAHLTAAGRLERGDTLPAIDVSTGRPASVLEVVRGLSAAAGVEPRIEWAPRAEGDPDEVWAEATMARQWLGWEPQWSLQDSLRAHWDATADGA